MHVLYPMLRAGLEQVAVYLGPGCTGALLGSSGVGKSTIINGLAGENIRKTGEVRESDQTGVPRPGIPLCRCMPRSSPSSAGEVGSEASTPPMSVL